jgi:hypothetical protein
VILKRYSSLVQQSRQLYGRGAPGVAVISDSSARTIFPGEVVLNS